MAGVGLRIFSRKLVYMMHERNIRFRNFRICLNVLLESLAGETCSKHVKEDEAVVYNIKDFPIIVIFETGTFVPLELSALLQKGRELVCLYLMLYRHPNAYTSVPYQSYILCDVS